MIEIIATVFFKALSVGKPLSFLTKIVSELSELLSDDLDMTFADLRRFKSVMDTLSLCESIKRNALYSSTPGRDLFEIRKVLGTRGAKTEAGEEIEAFATRLVALGCVLGVMNSYAFEKKVNLNTLLSHIFKLTLDERRSLEKNGETNISDRLGIDGMSLILIHSCNVASLIFKCTVHYSDSYEKTLSSTITQVIESINKPYEINDACQELISKKFDEASDYYQALANCTKFAAEMSEKILGHLNGKGNKKPENPQPDKQIPKGGMSLGGV